MQNIKKKIFIVFLLLVLAGGAGLAYYQYKSLNEQLSSVERNLNALQSNSIESQNQFDSLVEKTKTMKQQIDSLVDSYAKLANKPPEIIRQEIIQQKSQDELLTDAVSKITPTVASIVISKDVPKLEVVYTNPFGDDPFFKDFGIQVPTYRQIGTKQKKSRRRNRFYNFKEWLYHYQQTCSRR
jgi:hypothetical protein